MFIVGLRGWCILPIVGLRDWYLVLLIVGLRDWCLGDSAFEGLVSCR